MSASHGIADHSLQRASAPALSSPNRFKFGLFGANASGGQCGFTLAEGRLELKSWGEVDALARKADQLGLEAFIPIARWKAPAGPGHTWDRTYETFTWAAALAATTQHLQVFATCHVPFFAPVMAAKMVATVDHISNGRMGLNIVAGYNGPEFRMFDVPLRAHDRRYAVADEWTTIIKRLWSDEPSHEFDFEGDYYRLEGAESYPKPIQTPYPTIMSAGLSPAGRQFALDHADILFMAIPDVTEASSNVHRVRAEAAAAKREDLRLWSMVHIVCKDSEEEAAAYVRYYAEEKADWEGAHAILRILTEGDLRSVEHYKREALLGALVRSTNAIPLVGTAEQIVDGLEGLADAGLDGAAIAMVDYDEGLDRLRDEILPLMCNAGLRTGPSGRSPGQ